MAFSDKENQDLMKKMRAKMNDPNIPPIEKLRSACLSRGASGIKGLGRAFRIMDDDGSKNLDFEEYKYGLRDFGVDISDDELRALFQELDKDGSGKLSFDEFLTAMRGPMSKSRLSIIDAAFKKLDKSGDGVVTYEDLKGVYNCRRHPKVMNGEWTEKQCLENFLNNFEPDESKRDGKVTHEEFVNYYAGVSASIDNDAHFDLMMRNAWKL